MLTFIGKIPQKSLSNNMFMRIIIVILLMVVLVFNNLYTTRLFLTKVSDSNKLVLKFYIDQIDENLHQVENVLANYLLQSENVIMLGKLTEGTKANDLAMKVDKNLQEIASNYKNIDAFFVYSTTSETFLTQINGNYQSLKKNSLFSYMRELCIDKEGNKENIFNSWFVHDLKGTYHFVRVLKVNNNYVGMLVKVDTIINMFSDDDFEGFSYLFFTDVYGNSLNNKSENVVDRIKERDNFRYYAMEGDPIQYLSIMEQSDRAGYNLVALIPNRSIVGDLDSLQLIVFGFALIGIITILVMISFLQKSIMKPLRTLDKAMGIIEGGNLDIKVKEDSVYKEFQIVNRSFNNMTAQIKQLKIDVYEQQLEKQKTELQFLQLQTNPHFFMNALNVIYSLALTDNVDLIKRLVMCLNKHSRYMLKTRLEKVLLREELEFIENFVEIQQIRYHYHLHYEVEASEELIEEKIPPFLIQTFIENAVKYAITEEEEVFISVRIMADKKFMHIVIEDTGNGFPESVLLQLKKRVEEIEIEGEPHYGIANIERRLRLIYHDKDSITFVNRSQGGARIEIVIPREGNGSRV